MSAVAETPAASARSSTAHDASTETAPFIRYLFLLFVMTIPFESVDLGYGREAYSLAKWVGQVFALVAFVDGNRTLRRPPRVVWVFGLYVLLLGFFGLFVPEAYLEDLGWRFVQQLQLVFLLWLSFNIMRDERMLERTLLCFSLAATAVTILQVFGVGVRTLAWGEVERVTAFGDNPNVHGLELATAIVFLVSLFFFFGRDRSKRFAYGVTTLLCMPLLVRAMVATGSRGSLISLIMALAVLMLAGIRKTKALSVVGGVVLAIGLYYVVTHSDTMMSRIDVTITTKNTAGRDEIHAIAWEMFLERPIIGWGPMQNIYELGTRTGAIRRDTHNLYLWMLTEMGLFGGGVFLVGLMMCLASGFSALRRTRNPTSLALLTILLVSNYATTDHNRKLFWLCLAIALACDPKLTRPETSPSPLALSPRAPPR